MDWGRGEDFKWLPHNFTPVSPFTNTEKVLDRQLGCLPNNSTNETLPPFLSPLLIHGVLFPAQKGSEFLDQFFQVVSPQSQIEHWPNFSDSASSILNVGKHSPLEVVL